MLYTVVMDYRSGTYISQVKARSVDTALRVWTEHLDISGVAGLGRRRKAELIGEIKKQVSRREAPVPLDGVVNTWCASAATSGGLVIVNIIATARG